MELVKGKERKVLNDIRNPLDVLRKLSERFKPVILSDLNPFQGGMVGYFNYDLVRKWENLPAIAPEDPMVPESIVTVSRRLIIFDHFTHKLRVVVFVHLENHDHIKEAYDLACQEVDETDHELRMPLPCMAEEDSLSLSGLESNLSKKAFEEAVRKAKKYIASGDVIQVVLSQKFSANVAGEDFSLYRNLRAINPSPYMFYLNFGDVKLIGSSPEVLVRLEDNRIVLRPIAGTRPRGNSVEEDQRLEKELLEDPKERAEHIMLVDLGRNDVGKVAAPGSVTVPRLMEIERYSHVMHIVSSVEGRLNSEMDVFDLFVAAFPAGTVTGAPKIRAMEIIAELEPSPRGPYAGAVGYFGFNGNTDFCITIRTIAIVKNKLSIQVGAGIVYDSLPTREYEETINKAGAMFKAIEGVKKR
jgi:anthranilate synthase component 1